jgi:hypothetical protein
MTIEEVKSKLQSTKSPERRRAAKEIRKARLFELANALYQKYLEEKKDKRTWETQVEMIKAIGILDYKHGLNQVEAIVYANKPHDMITITAATTFVQLKRKSINDGQPVLELLNFGSVSVIHGALLALAIDKMMPDDETIQEILKICRDVNKHEDRIGHEFGLMDARQYLAIACANWNPQLTSDFLNHCIETAYDIDRFNKPNKNIVLIEVCQNSLNGKFSKAYLPW